MQGFLRARLETDKLVSLYIPLVQTNCIAKPKVKGWEFTLPVRGHCKHVGAERGEVLDPNIHSINSSLS